LHGKNSFAEVSKSVVKLADKLAIGLKMFDH